MHAFENKKTTCSFTYRGNPQAFSATGTGLAKKWNSAGSKSHRPVSSVHEWERRSTSLLTEGCLRLSCMTTGAKESIERSDAQTMIGRVKTAPVASVTGLPKIKATVRGSAFADISDIFLMTSIYALQRSACFISTSSGISQIGK